MGSVVSGRGLARVLGVSQSAIIKAVKSGRIHQLSDGKFDAEQAQKDWSASTDPARSKVNTLNTSVNTTPNTSQLSPTHSIDESPSEPTAAPVRPSSRPVRSEEEAREAIALIARILNTEGVLHDDGIDFNSARTADTILKAYERDLKIAQRRKELVPLAKVQEHVTKGFIGLRQTIQRIPARHASAIAAEIGCDAGKLHAALTRAIQAELESMSAPLVRA